IIVEMVIGALHVAAARPNHFEAGAATVFATLAGQLVVALQNIRLLKDTEDQAQRLAMLNKMGVALNLTLTLAETFKVAARHITRIVQGSYTSIALLTGSGDRLELYTPDGEDDSTLISADIPLRGTAIGKVVRDNALLNIADLTASPFTDFESLAQQGLHAGLIVPLVVGKQVIGTITVARGPAKPYTPREENLLLHIASFLASTIDNKRLFQQTQTALIETEVLYEASADLNTAQSYNEVLATLRQYTMLGQSAQNVSLNYFDTPWAKDRQPEWVHALARWGELPLKEDRVRYRLASFAAAKLLRPDLPTLIEDLSAGPEFDPDMYLLFNRQEGAKSAIVLPLVAAGQWIGYVEAGFPHPTTFPEAEVRQMMALVSQAAVAVQSLRALELAEQQTRELAAVNKVLQAVSRELDMEQVLSTLYQEVQGIIPVQAFFVALYNDRANTISYPILYDEGRPLRKAPVPLPAKGNLHHVITTGEPVLVNYSPQDVEAIISGQKDAGNFEGRPAASVLYIPLRLGRQTIGAISVQSYQFDAYSRREVELLSSLANHVAVAIENARLYKQAQARARREQILRQVTARVRSSVEVDAVMRTTAHEVDRLLGRRAFVYLGNRPPTLAPANPTAKEADNGH
ncbi:MAG: GAF domain-containing protein, partial [Anaerolineae bacterium]